jgi:hypothetical protein
MTLCAYGCGQESKYTLKNGKACCSAHANSCPVIKAKLKASLNKPETKEKMKIGIKAAMNNPDTKMKLSNSQKASWQRRKEAKATT